MVNPYRTILCWMLALSLAWLPLSSSAAISSQFSSGEHCEHGQLQAKTETSMLYSHMLSSHMNMTEHLVGKKVGNMTSNMPGMMHHQSDRSTNTLTQQFTLHKPCCDDCKNNCQCQNQAACGNAAGHHMSFLLSGSLIRLNQSVDTVSVAVSGYFSNQIISPDLRPPIV